MPEFELESVPMLVPLTEPEPVAPLLEVDPVAAPALELEEI